MKLNHPHHQLVSPAYEIVKKWANLPPPDKSKGEKIQDAPSWEEALTQADFALTEAEQTGNEAKIQELEKEVQQLEHTQS
jgi:hypothetical protein